MVLFRLQRLGVGHRRGVGIEFARERSQHLVVECADVIRLVLPAVDEYRREHAGFRARSFLLAAILLLAAAVFGFLPMIETSER